MQRDEMEIEEKIGEREGRREVVGKERSSLT
jgi:hypothetical protein